MCRLEMTESPEHAGEATLESFRKLMHLVPWSGQSFGRIDNTEGAFPTAVLYLTREGQGFPLVAEQQ